MPPALARLLTEVKMNSVRPSDMTKEMARVDDSVAYHRTASSSSRLPVNNAARARNLITKSVASLI